MEYIIVIILFYLIGNINPALITTKLVKNVDIREVNSKNAGTSNAVITLGLKWGIFVGVLDILKATIPILVLRLVLFPDNEIIWFVGGVSVIIGHVYPVFMGFRGGKGTATFGGLCFGIFPITAAIMFVSFVVLTIISDYVTVPTILAVVFVPIGMYFFDYQLVSVIIVSSYSLLSIYKHWPNIIKIIKKEEVGLRAVFKKD